MNCEEVNLLLDDPAVRAGAPLPEAAKAHLDACRECRALLELLSSPERPSEVSAGLKKKIEAGILNSLAPVRPLPASWIFAVSTMSAYCILVATGAWFLGSGGLASMSSLQIAGSAGLMAAAALTVSFYLRRQMVPGRPPGLAALLLGLLLVAVLVGSILLLLPWGPSVAFVSNGASCWGTGLILAIPSTFVFLWLARRGVFLARSEAGATVGLLAGLVGATVLQLRCPLIEASHSAVWHAGIVVASGLTGMLAGRLSALRSTAP
jgi:hypothetical protein